VSLDIVLGESASEASDEVLGDVAERLVEMGLRRVEVLGVEVHVAGEARSSRDRIERREGDRVAAAPASLGLDRQVAAIRFVPLHHVAAHRTFGPLLERLEVAGVLGAFAIFVQLHLDPFESHAVLGKPGEIAHQPPHFGDRRVELHADAVAQRARREV
jgi:hypothetical protein